MARIAAVAFCILAMMPIFGPGQGAAEETAPLDVVELFTSQACSSCPPADKLLGKLSGEEGLLALSYSVDYWDYLDWKDTLADPAFSERQKGYARSRGDRAVYTPQAVINGTRHAVGSDATELRKALAETAAGRGRTVPLDVVRKGQSLVVSAGAAPAGMPVKESTLWLVLYEDSATVRIARGENQGRTITYHNVVRRLEPVGPWRGEPVSITVALPETDGRRCAVLLQEGNEDGPGRILAADRL